MKRMSTSFFQLIVAATVVVSLGRSAAAQFDDVRASIEKKLTAQNVPSLAVAVARDGKIIWEDGFGWADREKRVRATEHTMYSLASISKPITATGLMVLVERGQVDLDRPINDYLGDAKLNGRAFDVSTATVRRVANHTAGLPLHYQFVLRGSRQRTGPQFKPIPERNGTWSGEVSTYEGALPVTFVIRASGEVFVQLGDRPWTLLDHAKFSDGVLSGIFAGDVATGDASRRPYNLRLQVRKREPDA